MSPLARRFPLSPGSGHDAITRPLAEYPEHALSAVYLAYRLGAYFAGQPEDEHAMFTAVYTYATWLRVAFPWIRFPSLGGPRLALSTLHGTVCLYVVVSLSPCFLVQQGHYAIQCCSLNAIRSCNSRRPLKFSQWMPNLQPLEQPPRQNLTSGCVQIQLYAPSQASIMFPLHLVTAVKHRTSDCVQAVSYTPLALDLQHHSHRT